MGSRKMNNLLQRTITGAVLVGVILALVTLSVYSFIALVLIINVLALCEFYLNFHKAGINSRRIAGLALSAGLLISIALVLSNNSSWRILLYNVPLCFMVFIAELFSNSKAPLESLGFTFLGIVFISLPIGAFMATGFLPGFTGQYHPGLIVGYFLMLWANDSWAYIVGNLVGSHPLFLRISPRKTWEGSIGGAVFALLAACISSIFFGIIPLNAWLTIALIVIVAGTFGDLFKSMMKRSLNIRDSGNWLPGHGGIIDRFDSLLGSAPFVFSYLLLS